MLRPSSIAAGTAALLTMLAAVGPGAGTITAGWSSDEPPAETLVDPGDVFFLGGPLEVDDACPAVPPFPFPCLGVPDEENFDLDGFSVDAGGGVCPPIPPPFPPGILFSFDDGDPGAGSGQPSNDIELFFYDRCGLFGGGSFTTNADELFIPLGVNPPPPPADDDVDAYEARDVVGEWDNGLAVLFSPDFPSTGALPPPGATCPVSSPQGTVYRNDVFGSLGIFADPCMLGVPDVQNCDIDAIVEVSNEPPFVNVDRQLLFSTDALQDCGLDPGDIFLSDLAGNFALWADDVNDLGIAGNENEEIDLDALSVNDVGPIEPGDPVRPPAPIVWKREYPDFAPSGMPDFSQDHGTFPPTYCGPTAIADCFWWFDSKFEGTCGGFAGDGVDAHPLITAYAGVGDDHDAENVEPLIQDLAFCMSTDILVPGTLFTDIEACVDGWMAGRGLGTGYTRTSRQAPTFEQIACEIERSENVILLLGFYEGFNRCGGHYATSAGVQFSRDPGPDLQPGQAGLDDDMDGIIDEADELCQCGSIGLTDDICGAGPDNRVAISDPGLNNAEPGPAGTGGPGRVLGPLHGRHAPAVPPPPPPPDHDFADNVSHDLYDVAPSVNGMFAQALTGYGQPAAGVPVIPWSPEVNRWAFQNPLDPDQEMFPCQGPVSVEIEAMLAISPRATRICLDAQPLAGGGQMLVHKGPCPSPASHPNPWDYVRGELCRLTERAVDIDLGEVDCLQANTPVDQYPDDTTPDIGGWFFLVRQAPAVNYGLSTSGKPRFPAGGDCP